MAPDRNEEQFEAIDLRLTAAEAKLVAHDTSLSAIRKLLLEGARMLVENKRELDSKVAALIDAQQRTEEALRRFIERSGNGHRS